MQRLKFTSKTTVKTSEGLKYKGYAVGELPPSFAFIYNDNKEYVEEWRDVQMQDKAEYDKLYHQAVQAYYDDTSFNYKGD